MASGDAVDQITVPSDNALHIITLTGEAITSIVITGGGGEGVLDEICIYGDEKSVTSDPYESDDDPGQASNIIVNGGGQTHNFHVAGDTDWVQFSATSGVAYVIETLNLGTNSDTILELYDTDGASLITEDDDGGFDYASRIEWQAPADGTFYVRVRHYNDSIGGANTEYDLKITMAAPTEAQCMGFEDLTLGDQYHVGDTFVTSGIQITASEFEWSSGDLTSDGFAEVDSGQAGGSGQDMWVNNILLNFDFGGPVPGLSLKFGEYGGNLNIEINGDFVNFAVFADIDGATIGGVDVFVTNGRGNDQGTLTLTGTIHSFAVGGQELWIDDVCPGEHEPPPPPAECVDFEDLTLGDQYHVGDTFVTSGVEITAAEFQVWTGDFFGGTAFVDEDGQVRGGTAGSSGQDLGVSNVLLHFDFGGPVQGLQLRFGVWGGTLNIEINDEFVNFGDFAEINNTVIGGVEVFVGNGQRPDNQGFYQGTLTLIGEIDSFAVGGQELYIDDVCPNVEQE